ncbi:flagellar protein FlbD [bacterium]|nr:flagellar protein FlbD [bacterium]
MIQVTRLDGARVYINETNIQWIEKLPDTAITFLSGARIIVRETPEDIAAKVNALRGQGNSLETNGIKVETRAEQVSKQ